MDVYAPAPGSHIGDALPVLVFIHGGGYVAGSIASPWYDGAAFVRDGIITVNIGYRLGMEGFGSIQGAPENRGVRDWILALNWVRHNIADFGGDPGRVTIMGQSAGGGAVMTLLSSPAAQGLFAGAISLSGVPTDIPLAQARRHAELVAQRLGRHATRDDLLHVDEADLIAVQGFEHRPPAGLQPALDRLAIGGVELPLGPVVDGEILEAPVREMLSRGIGASVPLLLQSTREEFGGRLIPYAAELATSTPADILNLMGVPPHLAYRYIHSMPQASAIEVADRYAGDLLIRAPLLEWADLRPAGTTWISDFAWRSPSLGVARHCLDLPFVFDVPDAEGVRRVTGDGSPALSLEIHNSIVRFVQDANPRWPVATASGPARVFGGDSALHWPGYESARVLVRTGERPDIRR